MLLDITLATLMSGYTASPSRWKANLAPVVIALPLQLHLNQVKSADEQFIVAYLFACVRHARAAPPRQ